MRIFVLPPNEQLFLRLDGRSVSPYPLMHPPGRRHPSVMPSWSEHGISRFRHFNERLNGRQRMRLWRTRERGEGGGWGGVKGGGLAEDQSEKRRWAECGTSMRRITVRGVKRRSDGRESDWEASDDWMHLYLLRERSALNHRPLFVKFPTQHYSSGSSKDAEKLSNINFWRLSIGHNALWSPYIRVSLPGDRQTVIAFYLFSPKHCPQWSTIAWKANKGVGVWHTEVFG